MNRMRKAMTGAVLGAAVAVSVLATAGSASACPVSVCGGEPPPITPQLILFHVDGWTCAATYYLAVPHHFKVRCTRG